MCCNVGQLPLLAVLRGEAQVLQELFSLEGVCVRGGSGWLLGDIEAKHAICNRWYLPVCFTLLVA